MVDHLVAANGLGSEEAVARRETTKSLRDVDSESHFSQYGALR